MTIPTYTLPSPVGLLTLEEFDLDRDVETLHGWVTDPRSRFWGLLDADLDTLRNEYAALGATPHHHVWWGRLDGSPTYLVETYDPAHSELASHYPVQPGDVGMHLLVAPTERPVHGLTTEVMRAVMSFLFSPTVGGAHGRVDRVVVEPDVRNAAIARKNVAAGFVVERAVRLSDKEAALSFCTRADFARSSLAPAELPSFAHLRPEHLAAAQRHLVAKALAEFAHERLVVPQEENGGYRLDVGPTTYRFRADVLPLEHWVVEPGSIERTVAGSPAELDALDLVSELQQVLGLPDELLGTYLEELSGTLASAMYKRHHHQWSAAELVEADFQTVEAAMTEGHPAFVANNGRIGLGVDDHDRYSPEAGRPVRLEWVAVRRTHAHLALGAGMDEETLYAEELGADQLDRFAGRLGRLGLDAAEYLYLPAHPWQVQHRLGVTFAADLARRDLVPLGPGADRYQAQQSIRTFFNNDRPDRRYVKTALAIQNMGFLRGLSPAYMRMTPAINDWVHDTVSGDPVLAECGFGILREVATVGYTGDAYHRAGPDSPHRKMVAALWRESPVPSLAPGERLASMASLLHRDAGGRSLMVETIRASGLAAEEWVAAYLRGYVRPLVHCLRAHDLAFMPHGENLIMVLRDHRPVRVLMKDIGEEVAVLAARELPGDVGRIVHPVVDEVAALSLQTDVFDGVLRFVAAILHVDGVLAAERFWGLVADCVREYLEEAGAGGRDLDLFGRSFPHSCLNRLQLRNTRQMVDLADPAGSLMFAGRLDNPLASSTVPVG